RPRPRRGLVPPRLVPGAQSEVAARGGGELPARAVDRPQPRRRAHLPRRPLSQRGARLARAELLRGRAQDLAGESAGEEPASGAEEEVGPPGGGPTMKLPLNIHFLPELSACPAPPSAPPSHLV